MSHLTNKIKLLSVLSLALLFSIAGCDRELTTNTDSSSNGELQAVDGRSEAVNLQNISQQDLEQRLQEFAEKQDSEGGVAEQKVKELLSHAADQNEFRK